VLAHKLRQTGEAPDALAAETNVRRLLGIFDLAAFVFQMLACSKWPFPYNEASFGASKMNPAKGFSSLSEFSRPEIAEC